jgi:hypothetical protein
MSLGPTRNPVCNQCGQATPMIAIPAADDCRSLQVPIKEESDWLHSIA